MKWKRGACFLTIIFSHLIFHSSRLSITLSQLKRFFCTQSTRWGWCTRARACTLWVLERQMRQRSRLSWPGLAMVSCSSQLRLTTRPVSQAVWLCRILTQFTYSLLWVYPIVTNQFCYKLEKWRRHTVILQKWTFLLLW